MTTRPHMLMFFFVKLSFKIDIHTHLYSTKKKMVKNDDTTRDIEVIMKVMDTAFNAPLIMIVTWRRSEALTIDKVIS